MKLIGCLPVKNEAWVIRLTIRVALKWCDHIIVLDNGSTDQTGQYLNELALANPGRLTIFEQGGPVWNDMDNRQFLLNMARQAGATHIAIVDADEIVTSDIVGGIREAAEKLPDGIRLNMRLRNLVGSVTAYRGDGYFHAWGDMVFKDHPKLHWTARKGYQFHHRKPFGLKKQFQRYGPSGGVMHLSMVRHRAFLAKVAYYKMIERIRWNKTPDQINRQYDWWRIPGPERTVPPGWWLKYKHEGLLDLLSLDDSGETWHVYECRKLLAKHDPDQFAGLDLFGIPEGS